MASGPTHWANNAGSVWARNSCSDVAAKSRVVRMTGSLGSASMTVSVILSMLVSLHLRQDGVKAAVALLDAAAVALDPGVHQVEGLDLQAHRPGLRSSWPADEPGVLEDPQVLVDGLQRHLVRLGQLAHSRVALREPGHHVAPGRIREGGEDPGQRVRGHLLSFNSMVERTVDRRSPVRQPCGWLGDRPETDTAQLVVSELATNAIRHTRNGLRDGSFGVTPPRKRPPADPPRPRRRQLSTPHLRQAQADDQCGRGLHLVETLTTRWGVQGDDAGRTIWTPSIPSSSARLA
jgi:serine/threonine-protein kinase RsbW